MMTPKLASFAAAAMLAAQSAMAVVTVPYDTSTMETTPITMTAEDVEAATWPLDVTLSNPIAIPSGETLPGGTLALLKIAKADREVTPADFNFTTGSATLLPRGVITVEDDPDDSTLQVVSFVYRPVAVYVATSSTTVKSLNTSSAWSTTPASTYDYYCTGGGELRTKDTGAETFSGGSLTLDGKQVVMKNKVTINDLVLLPGGSIYPNSQSGTTYEILGKALIAGTEARPAVFTSGNSLIKVSAALYGNGVVRFTNSKSGTHTCSIAGDNSNFTGPMKITSSTGETDSSGLTITINSSNALGGAPDEFNYKALTLSGPATLLPNSSMTLDTKNRGIYVEAGGFSVNANQVLTIKQPLRVNGTLLKHGAGTLALGGEATFGADGTSGGTGSDNIFKIKAGNVEALSDAAVKGFAFNFSEGAGILLKPGIGLQYGLAGSFTATAAIPVAFDLPDGLPDMKTFSVPICTVVSGEAPQFEVAAIDGVTLSVVEETVSLDGYDYTRYSLSCYNPSAPLFVPYNAETGTTTPVAFSGTAAETFVEDSEWPLAVKLSESIALPTDGGTLALLKLPKAAKVITAEDFVFDVASDLLLPRATLSVAEDPNDSSVQVLSVTLDPVVVFVSPTQVNGMNATKSDDGNYFTWSNETAPGPNADYYFGSGVTWYSNDGYNTGTAAFNGRSLSIENSTLTLKHRYLNLSDLILLPGGKINCGGYQDDYCYHEINGAIRVNGTDAQPSAIYAGSNRNLFYVHSVLSGDGVLRLAKESDRQMTSRLTGDNSAFTGRLVFSSNKGGTDGTGLTVEIPAPSALGGAPEEFMYNALTLQGPSTLAPAESMTLDTEKRGIYVTAGGFSVAEDLILTVKEPIRVNGTLLKHGAGTLALEGEVSFGADGTSAGNGNNNVFKIKAGNIEALSDAAVAGFAFNFSEGAGILLKPGAGLVDGLKGSFTTAENAKIPVAVDLSAGFPADAPTKIPVCTITSGTMPEFEVVPAKGFKIALEYDDETSPARCYAKCQKVGFSIVIR